MLYIVATPIGNLEDLSKRAINILNEVDLILTEDTRHFSKLANRYEIKTQLKSNHEHNEIRQLDSIIKMLKLDKNIALVSDAGTPCISDPGYRLVKACHENDITVSTAPGACAAIAALSISGLPSDKFIFNGFLPVKPGKKEKELVNSLNLGITSIFYESPHRIVKSIKLIDKLTNNRTIFVVREISKKFETYYRGLPKDVLEKIGEKTKGEFVIVISKEL